MMTEGARLSSSSGTLTINVTELHFMARGHLLDRKGGQPPSIQFNLNPISWRCGCHWHRALSNLSRGAMRMTK